MSRSEKVLKKFLTTPTSFSYPDIALVLVHLGFEKISAKGSHVKWKHEMLKTDLIIPVHNHECKPFYKELARTRIQTLIDK